MSCVYFAYRCCAHVVPPRSQVRDAVSSRSRSRSHSPSGTPSVEALGADVARLSAVRDAGNLMILIPGSSPACCARRQTLNSNLWFLLLVLPLACNGASTRLRAHWHLEWVWSLHMQRACVLRILCLPCSCGGRGFQVIYHVFCNIIHMCVAAGRERLRQLEEEGEGLRLSSRQVQARALDAIARAEAITRKQYGGRQYGARCSTLFV